MKQIKTERIKERNKFIKKINEGRKKKEKKKERKKDMNTENKGKQ
jgi:hypothetical protein